MVITFNIDTKEFAEYTDNEWGEEIAVWQEELWEKYEDGVFEFENSEIVQIYNQGRVYTYEFNK